MTWHAWSDGSCVHPWDRGRGFGAWAAVVEHGSDGFVLRGSEANVTSSKMELVGALQALASIPRGEQVVLHVDCTTLLAIRHAWERARAGADVKWHRRRDPGLWLAIAHRMDELDVTVAMVARGVRDPVHQRCHRIANAEARALRAAAASQTSDRPSILSARGDG